MAMIGVDGWGKGGGQDQWIKTIFHWKFCSVYLQDLMAGTIL